MDIEPQPHYPFEFVQADALTVDVSGFDVVAASPPCQKFSRATPPARRDLHTDLLDPIRLRLRQAVEQGEIGAYVIENVPGAPMQDPITICGETLRLGVQRHRLFESNLPLFGTPCHHDRGAPAVPVYGSYTGRNPVEGQTSPAPTDRARAAMGIDWMPWPTLTQAIPPAYTAWIGVQLIGHAATVTQASWRKASRPEVTQPPRRVSVTDRRCRCGAALYRPATGRWPRHCSHACRQAAYRERTKGTAA
ncbi:hypothetical protein V1227_17105 [Lentzea sp. DG1S-22]|uniref:hypothetical protein n=1 Tax=Lentzea sp. DG1S-22 TaxID=3108822 RepID=UPI002E78B1D8|nr:hypothetical protein [Lentzea sp. DG1S-22]WVH84389.1 hypothetical protein V1227_17105 [Lentzea sp. DG1S-22]